MGKEIHLLFSTDRNADKGITPINAHLEDLECLYKPLLRW